MNTSEEHIKQILSKCEFLPQGFQFIGVKGKDIKRKKKNGYWFVRVSLKQQIIEAYCAKIVYYINTGTVPDTVRFLDENKDNLDFKNLKGIFRDKKEEKLKFDAEKAMKEYLYSLWTQGKLTIPIQ